MEQNNILQTAKKAQKKNNSSTIRFSKDFLRRVSKLVEKANKKPFGKKIKSRAILENLFNLADEKLLENVIKKAQEESLSHGDKREVFINEKLSKFNGSKEKLELKMMEVFDQYLSQNQIL